LRFEIPLRVYHEDTDLMGIVYYANYLKFIERVRSDWVRSLGIDQAVLRSTEGIAFAVRRIEADYLSPAKYGDDLIATLTLTVLGGASLRLHQEILRGGAVLFAANVVLVCLDRHDKAMRIPAHLRELFG
jgi:acyl-CoA thioester hydrolase